MIDESTRRLRDTMAMQDPSMGEQFNKHTFVVNTNSPLIESLVKTENKELAKELTQHLYELSLLGQRELKGAQIKGLIERSNKLLTELI